MIIELELKVQQLSKEAGLTSSTHSKLMQEKVQNELLFSIINILTRVGSTGDTVYSAAGQS